MSATTLPPPRPGAKVSVQRAFKTKDGKVRFRVTYMDATGTRQRVVMGTRQQAEDAAGPLRKMAYESKAFGWRPAPVATMATLRDLHVERTRELVSARKNLERWPLILEWFGPTTLISAVLPSDVALFRRWLLTLPSGRREGDADARALARATGADPWGDRKRHSPTTANRYLSTLGGAFSLAVEDRLATDNPVKPSHYSREKKRTRVPQGDEFARMLAAVNPQVRLAAIIASETCLRQASIAGLTWDRVSLERRTIFVPDTKARVPVLVPISQALHVELAAWRAKHGDRPRVLTCSGAHIADRWRKTRDHLGISGLRFHDLRRAAATKLLSAGVPLDVVMAIGGWRKADTLIGVYASINDARISDARDKIDTFDRR